MVTWYFSDRCSVEESKNMASLTFSNCCFKMCIYIYVFIVGYIYISRERKRKRSPLSPSLGDKIVSSLRCVQMDLPFPR